MEHALAGFLAKFTYLAIFGVLTAAGLGAPISEDLTLLLGGGLAAQGVTMYWPTMAAGYFGVLFGDVLIHHWGGKSSLSVKETQHMIGLIAPTVSKPAAFAGIVSFVRYQKNDTIPPPRRAPRSSAAIAGQDESSKPLTPA